MRTERSYGDEITTKPASSTIRSSKMGPLSVADEYQNNPNLRKDDIKYLKEWLSKQPHLPDVPEDMLIIFLHACDYKLEATKHTIECNYSLKTHVQELWSNRDPRLAELQRALRVIEFARLPSRDKDGNVVLMCRLHDLDSSHFIHTDVTKVFAMYHDLLLHRAGLVPGIVIVLHEKGVTLSLAKRINISLLKKYLTYLQDGFPGKIASIHVINSVPVSGLLVSIARPFLKSELLSKLKVHDTNLKSFYEYVPQEMLPEEYGGNAGFFKYLHNKMVEELEQHLDWFMDEEKLRVDESKRLGPN